MTASRWSDGFNYRVIDINRAINQFGMGLMPIFSGRSSPAAISRLERMSNSQLNLSPGNVRNVTAQHMVMVFWCCQQC
jgi:hypothetical protein